MYKEDMRKRIKYLRTKVCGYSQRHLARLAAIDLDLLRMIEHGEIKNPQPNVILRIADALDSFYMEFVDDEEEFLLFLDWGTYDDEAIGFFKDSAIAISLILSHYYLKKDIDDE